MTGAVVWITGRPASGKSTLAAALHQHLRRSNTCCVVLDGDDVRNALSPSPAYTDDARDHFYATLANLATLLARQGATVLVPATAHRAAWRHRARAIAPAFVEVYVDAAAELCAERDSKGLYARVAAGAIANLPGIDVAYEPPASPDVVVAGTDVVAAIADIEAALAHTHKTAIR